MKICLINNLYKPFSRGGAERVVELTKKGLVTERHEVFIISTRPLRGTPELDKNPAIFYLPSLYHSWHLISKIFRPFFHITNFLNPFASRKIIKILKENKIELVVTNNLLGLNLLFLRKLSKLSIRHIHVLHDIQFLHPSGLMFYGREKIIDTVLAKIYQKLIKFFTVGIDKIVSPSKWLLNEHKKRGFFLDKKTQILLNPVESPRGAPGKIKSDSDGIKLLFVGLLSEAKGLLILFEAFRVLSEKYNIKLILVGKNLIGKKLNAYLDNNKSIKYLGELKHEDVFENMREADILVMPSLCYENSPSVIYEAINLDLPVIASDIGGISELTQGSDVQLFQPGDSSDLIEKIIKMRIRHQELIKKEKTIKLLSAREYVLKLLS